MKKSVFSIAKRLFVLIKPLKFHMAFAILLGFLGHLCATFITVFGAMALARGLGAESMPEIGMIFISVCIFAVLRGILRYGEQTLNHFIAFKLLAHIRDIIFVALRRLCPAKLEGKDRGNLISLITSDIELLEVFYAHTISPVAIAVLFAVFMTGFIARYHVVSGLIAALAFVFVGAILPMIAMKNNGGAAMRFRMHSGALSSFVLDSLRGIFELLQYNFIREREDELNRRSVELSAEERDMKLRFGKYSALTGAVIYAFDILFLLVGSYLYSVGKIDFTGLLITEVALMSSFGPFVALSNLGSMLQNTFAAANRVLDLLDEEPEVEDITGCDEVSFESAKASNVMFSYDDEVILNNMSLDVKNGKIVGLVGRSGSGKSTLLKLFMRFWSADKGEISISGKNVENINTNDLRFMESYVTQDTHLFHDSIKNNLLIANKNASDEQIIEACKSAAIHDFIMSLPKGYDTEVGELGDTLSGGQRQRIGLARAFLNDAEFMLLDEPTSNLDSLNEAVILKSLSENRGKRTVLLVSHRQSTMRIADEVYAVENGRMS